MSRKVYPIPEAILKGPWDIKSSARAGGRAYVGIGSSSISVPLTDDPYDQIVRTHEMAHVAYSPRDAAALPADIDHAILAAVEDVRVNVKAQHLAKVNMKIGYDPDMLEQSITKLVQSQDWRNLALGVTSLIGLPASYKVAADTLKEMAVSPKEVGRIAQIVDYVQKQINPGSSFDHTVSVSSWVQDRLAATDAERELEKKAESKKGDGAASGMHKAALEGSSDWLDERMSSIIKVGSSYHKWSEKDYTPDGRPHPREIDPRGLVPWGRMTIEEPPRGKRLPGHFGRRRRPYDSGDVVQYPERWASDKMIFARKMKGLGGAVLIDGSGSMSLTPKQVMAILESAPGATVAIYGSPSGRHGILRILAKRGLRTLDSLICSPGGHNVIDYPALLWLATQDGPRIWVSDGIVTGTDDMTSTTNYKQCQMFCRSHQILRLPHMEQTIEYMQKLRRAASGLRVESAA